MSPIRKNVSLPVTLALALSLFGTTRAAQAAEPARRFEGKLTPCAVEGVTGDAYCGALEVWENRTARSGRRIPIRVVVLPARGASIAPDPVVFFEGGPGIAGTKAAAEIGGLLDGARLDRDLVFFDQRGTGRSNGLDCPVEARGRDVQAVVDTMFPLEVLRACRAGLEKRADLAQYSTVAAMDDLDEVRAWLGYERWNLFGISYGTIAARFYLRQHPEHVRSVVLMGVAPIDTPSPLEYAAEAQSSLDRVLDDCGADARCRGAFPDPRGDLATAFAALARSPVPVEIVEKAGEPTVRFTLSRDFAAATIRSLLYDAAAYPEIPALLHAAAGGDFAPLARRALAYGRSLAADGMGAYLTFMCPESTFRIDAARIPAATAGTFLGDSRVRDQVAACALWPRRALPPGFDAPVASPAPVLLVSGWIDPVTPPEIAAEVARTLPNSLHLVLRDGGHGSFGLMGEECAWQVIDDFFADGSPFRLDTSCIARMRHRPFDLTPRAE